jgi:hypothetical protein
LERESDFPSLQKANPNRKVKTPSLDEMSKFLGVLVAMMLVYQPYISDYWNRPDTKHGTIFKYFI